ncbi:TetR/AcrR family transcriptional regulator [Actinophytocola sp.]|uniref:TetR/AcrR family transcriptional regulator n=1 Tax=Actinophytocola sp. TaxID=1872138 RepID=UPI002D4F2FBE|nr:TetR/AcrR family transcriptional regulator [Actinophytocola sp.]HYQ62635.1 TetR/AcrR family transcriptional regulator [Actinophytocola sp.]
MGPTRERRRRMPRAERERQMVEVAEEIFADRGFLATSMDDVAGQVGVSKPMIYEYFGSKEGLFVACIRSARAELLNVTLKSVEGVTSAEEAMRRGLTAFFEFTDSHRRSWKLLQAEAAVAGPGAVAEIEAVRQQQTAVNTRLFASFLQDLAHNEREAYAEMVVGACERLSLWYVQRDDVSAAAAAELVMRMVWFGLRPD